VINHLFEIGDFIRRFRAKTRFGRLSREPLQLLRLEWDADSAVCEWVARSHDAFDTGLPGGLAERNESSQALEDAIAVRDLLFVCLPSISSVQVRVYRRSAGDYLDLVITGTVRRQDEVLRDVASLAMRAKLCGFQFTLDDGKLRPVIGEFLKSRGDGCLKESATARLPPIGSEV
jgi:hypothetical protein